MPEVEPFPFATLDELKERWPDFPPGADKYAEKLLEDGSQFILDVCPSAANASESTRRRVLCAVVKRRMYAEQSDLAGLASASLTTGPFAESMTPANPDGDFFLKKQERRALGEGQQKAFGVKIADTGCVDHRPWCALAFGAVYCSCGADLTLEGPLWEE
ncbi:hypothetical protein [Brevibacterium sp. SMBL_HHYL_HB1]|uniref:hypothetical protein n=1 Tax=Brevibacterium sp. SMBL_HHYL_HB1 TaxID=2777556 RepID=UPI001BAB4C3E|nr:hypothetical protein [Brevibacterium sp. SMBL_HHYL_HB1]QUL79922.1 hypothetical protein IG171_03500 [Brevibacterium sp. SMBL_HHYL_HB1]